MNKPNFKIPVQQEYPVTQPVTCCNIYYWMHYLIRIHTQEICLIRMSPSEHI